MLEENFWQNKSESQKIIKEKKLFEDLINSHNYSVNQLNDLNELYELALEENNNDIQNEVNQNILDLRSKKNGQKFFKEPASDRTGNSEKSNGPLGVGQWLGGILSKK